MALSGMVHKTRKCGNDVVVFLAPIEDEQGHTSPVGQRRLVIKDATLLPLAGDIIWGGGDYAVLNRGVNNKREWHYDRKGYVTLVEKFGEGAKAQAYPTCPACGRGMLSKNGEWYCVEHGARW